MCLAGGIVKGKVLQTDQCTLNPLLASVVPACSASCWFGSLFPNPHTGLWSLLSHHLVDVFYLLVQHRPGGQLSLGPEAQSCDGVGQRGDVSVTVPVNG